MSVLDDVIALTRCPHGVPLETACERCAHIDRWEVRHNDDGTIDEVLLFVGDRCVFHLEQMSKRSWYFVLYAEGQDVAQFYVTSKRRVRVTWA